MQDVKIDREKYIGGSDIPIIMGISHFKSRYDLLLEKAGLKVDNFEGNEYTEYGNVMEPKIRDYVNAFYHFNFKEDKLINGDVRCHFDGIDYENKVILEIKTTSIIHNHLLEYGVYLVQLLFYMMNSNMETGILAIYERKDDFDENFDENNLHIYDVTIDSFKDLCYQIMESVQQFRIDLQRIKENPFLTEQDLINNDIVTLANEVIKLETQLKSYDELKKRYEEFKTRLKESMQENNIKKWETPNGTLITLVADTPDKEVDEEYYDEERFIHDNPELHEQYHLKLAEYKETHKVLKKGKKGYVKITLKGE